MEPSRMARRRRRVLPGVLRPPHRLRGAGRSVIHAGPKEAVAPAVRLEQRRHSCAQTIILLGWMGHRVMLGPGMARKQSTT